MRVPSKRLPFSEFPLQPLTDCSIGLLQSPSASSSYPVKLSKPKFRAQPGHRQRTQNCALATGWCPNQNGIAAWHPGVWACGLVKWIIVELIVAAVNEIAMTIGCLAIWKPFHFNSGWISSAYCISVNRLISQLVHALTLMLIPHNLLGQWSNPEMVL